MRVVTVDWFVDANDCVNYRFGDRPEIANIELIIWNMAASLSFWNSRAEELNGVQVLSPADAATVVETLGNLKTLFECAVGEGALFVVMLPSDTIIHGHTLQEPVPIDFSSPLPGAGLRTTRIDGGGKVRINAGEPFRGFLSVWEGWCAPTIAVQTQGLSLSHDDVSGAPLVVYDYQHPGGLLVVPVDDTFDRVGQGQVLDSLKMLAHRLRPEFLPRALPDWLNSDPPTALLQARTREAAYKDMADLTVERLERARLRRREVELAWAVAAGAPESALRSWAAICSHLKLEVVRALDVPGTLVLRRNERVWVLIPILEREVEHSELDQRVAESLASVIGEADSNIQAVVVFLAENECPLHSRIGPSKSLREHCKGAGWALVRGFDLLEAWARSDMRPLESYTD